MIITTPEQDAQVDGPITEPCYAIEINLDAPTYWSTRQDLEFDGMVFLGGYIQENSLKIANDELRLSFYNEDFRHTNNARSGIYARSRVRVWWAYGIGSDSGETYPDPILMFDGFIYETPSIDEWISVVAAQTPPKRFPSPRLRPPFANHLPTAGYTVQFDGAVLRVEGRR